MSTNIATRLHLLLGRAEDQTPVSLDLAASPHTFVCGSSGTGRTTLLRCMATSALERGFDAVIIDTVKRAVGFRALADRAALVGDKEEAVTTLEDLVAEMHRRAGLLVARGASTVRDLPAAEDLKPILVVIDEYELQGDLVKHLASKLTRQGRSTGIHVAIGALRPDYQTVRAEVRDHVGNVIIMARAGRPVGTETAAMLFRGSIHGGLEVEEAVNAALAEASTVETRGHGVLVSKGTVTRFQADLPADAIAVR